MIMRGVNDDEIADFVELTRHKAINVRFIEYMPFDGNVWSNSKMVTYKQMMAAVQQRFPNGLQRIQASSPHLSVQHAVIPYCAEQHISQHTDELKCLVSSTIWLTSCVRHIR